MIAGEADEVFRRQLFQGQILLPEQPVALATKVSIGLAKQYPLFQSWLWQAAQANADCRSFLQQRTDDVRTAHDLDFQLDFRMGFMEISEEVIVMPSLHTADGEDADLAHHVVVATLHYRPQA
ncbi:hypothetical protein D3C79_885630 [compost metagenome]